MIFYAADRAGSLSITSPAGENVLADQLSPSGQALGPDAGILVHCGGPGLGWSTTFPTLEGTDHRLVFANTLILDVPAQYQAALPCGLQKHQRDEQ